MLGEIPSSVIDTDTFIINFHVGAYIHAFANMLKAYCNYLYTRPAGIIYLVSNVSIFEEVSLNKKDCPRVYTGGI